MECNEKRNLALRIVYRYNKIRECQEMRFDLEVNDPLYKRISDLIDEIWREIEGMLDV